MGQPSYMTLVLLQNAKAKLLATSVAAACYFYSNNIVSKSENLTSILRTPCIFYCHRSDKTSLGPPKMFQTDYTSKTAKALQNFGRKNVFFFFLKGHHFTRVCELDNITDAYWIYFYRGRRWVWGVGGKGVVGPQKDENSRGIIYRQRPPSKQKNWGTWKILKHVPNYK